MASFLTDLVKPYVEKLINGAIKESSYICCFTCIAKDFEDEKARLEVERTTFKQLVDVATGRGEDVQATALFWEKQADELIQEDTKTKQKCFFGFCCNCIWKYRRGKELANKKEQIKKLTKTRKELAIGLPAHLPYVERYSSQHYIPFKSRESKYKELLDALTDDNNYIVGLQGMGGTGKTTLAKEVGKKLKQSKQFTIVIDTTVSFSPDIKKIQHDIAGPLGLKFDDCNESDRPKKLWSRLTNGEKILLILDDVWGDINFNEIGISYRDNRKGCSILVTTRNLLVCNRLGCSSTIQLDLLSEEDAWIMFQRYAGLSEISTKKLLEKGCKIANECKRLPIAIAAIASSLKGEQRREVWDVTLNSLKKPALMHGVNDNVVQIYTCLLLSYYYLKDVKAKGLFLLCSIFRENEEIPIERLTRLCIGAGLSGEDYGSYEDARIQTVRSKNKLLDSGLLFEANQSGVKMYDLVRDAAQWRANNEIQTIQLYDKNQEATVKWKTNIKYLLCEGNIKDVFSFKPEGFKLEILIVIMDKDEDCHNVKIEVPNPFFENNTGLRVFHLFYNHYPKLPLSLPQSIQSLKNIRSLLFTHVDLGDISILGNLQSLETLDLKDCKIDELPHGIAKLEKFRLLNLEGCEIERNNPFEVIKECSSLEELYFTGSFNAFCREITLPKLRRFCIDEYSKLGNDSSSKYVSVVDKDGVFLSETTLKYCMQTAEVLRIRTIDGGWRNLIPEIVSMDLGMKDMVELSLSCFSQLQCLIDTVPTNFQVANVLSNLVVLELNRLEILFNGPIDWLKNLEKLSIKDCKHLQSLFNCNLNLCNLKTVKVQNCPMLVSLFQPLTSRSLVLLEKLQIANCEGLENIISDERRDEESKEEIDDGDDNDNKSHGSLFPMLKVLDIEECPRLQDILPFLSSQCLENLEKLSIKDCKHLRSLFKFKFNLCNLKTIILQSCPMLVSLYQLLTSRNLMVLETLKISHCERLENIIADERRGEESIEEIDDKRLDSMLQKLKVLDIEGCPLLESIFPFLFVHDLPVLETIKVRRCDGLKYIFGQYQDVEFSSLRQLELSQLPNFIDMFCKSNHPISFSEMGSSSTSNSGSKAQLQLGLEEFSSLYKYNIFSWDTTTTIPLVDGHYLESKSYCLNIWERAQCLQIPSTILYNIKKIELSHISKIQSVFIPSIAPRMMLETLTIRNCDELKSIIDFGDYESGSNNWGNVFPKMKELYIEGCPKMEYIFGRNTDDHQNHVGIQLLLLELKCLSLCNLPSLVAMCTKRYRIRFPPLAKLELNNCSQAAMKSMSNFIIHPVSESLDSPIIQDYVDIVGSQETTEINNQGSLNDGSFMKVSSNIKEQIPKEDDVRVSKSRLSSIASQLPSKDFPDATEFQTTSEHELSSSHENGIVSNKYEIVETEMNATAGGKQEYFVNIPGLVIPEVENSEVIVETKMKQTEEANQEFVVNVSDLEILEVANSQTNSQDDDWDGQIYGPSQMAMIEPLATQSVVDDEDWDETDYTLKLEMLRQFDYDLRNEQDLETTKDVAAEVEVQATSGHMLQLCLPFQKENSEIIVETKMKQTAEANQEFVVNVSGLEILEIANSQKLLNEQSTSQLREIDTAVRPSQDIKLNLEDITTLVPNAETIMSSTHSEPNISSSGPLVTYEHKTSTKLEGSTSEKTAAAAAAAAETMSTNSKTKNEADTQFYAPKQKSIKISVEDGTTSANGKTITSSTHSDSVSLSSGPSATSECEASSPASLKETEKQRIEEGSTSETKNDTPIQLVSDLKQKGIKLSFEDVEHGDSQETTQTNNEGFDLYLHMESAYRQFQEKSKCHDNGNENPNAQTTKEFEAWIEAEASSRHKLTSSQIKMKPASEAEHEFEEIAPDFEIPPLAILPTNSELEGSTSEKTAAGTLSAISGTKNAPPIQLDIAPKQKGIDKSVEERTTSTYDKTITSSTHLEDGDGKISIPSLSIVNTKSTATKYADIGDSQETIEMEDINSLIEDDPLLAFEKLITGQVSISSIGVLLQELKTLMDSSSGLDHLVSNQESKSKLISLFHQLNQHQGMLTSDLKNFVEKVQNFFNENIIKHATSQQVLNKHSQLLDLKSDLMNKLWSAKNTQAHIDSETSTANDQIHELSLQIDDLKSVVKKCNVQKLKLKAECTDWAQQSKELISALASSKVAIREVERARNLAKEDFANLKSSFPTF